MRRYLIGRAVSSVISIFSAAVLIFFLIHLVPGDPVRAMLGESAHAADLAAMRTSLGLDRPLSSQFSDYLAGLIRLDLGRSLRSSRAVSDLIVERCGRTFLLAVVAMTLAVSTAVVCALVAALQKGTFVAGVVLATASAGWVVPGFWLGPLLIAAFSVKLGVLPVSGASTPAHLVLPSVTLAIPLSAYFTRLVSERFAAELVRDTTRAARGRGLSELRLLVRHVLPNALYPLLPLAALEIGGLLSGAIIVETVFSWPGLGRLLIDAVSHRDYPVVQGCVLFIAVVWNLTSLSGDMLLAAIDPRVREGLH